MTHTDPCPWLTIWPNGRHGTRYASESQAKTKAATIGGTYKYEPRS